MSSSFVIFAALLVGLAVLVAGLAQSKYSLWVLGLSGVVVAIWANLSEGGLSGLSGLLVAAGAGVLAWKGESDELREPRPKVWVSVQVVGVALALWCGLLWTSRESGPVLQVGTMDSAGSGWLCILPIVAALALAVGLARVPGAPERAPGGAVELGEDNRG